MVQGNLKQKLDYIEKSEKELGILGVEIYSDKNPTTEECADSVIATLDTIRDIQTGKVKYTVPNFELYRQLVG